MDKAKLAALLKESQTPETHKLKAITAELQQNYYAHPESLLALIEIAGTDGDSSVRQQAAVQAARLTTKHWSSVPENVKPAVREQLVQGILREPDAKCRHADSRLIAGIACLDLEDGKWTDLIPALYSLSTSNDVSQRIVGSYILFSLVEANPSHFSEQVLKLLEVFSMTIRDPENAEVRINTMQGLGAMMMLLDPEDDEAAVKAFHTVIPSMVEVLKDAVQTSDDEKVTISFEVFQQFLAYESAILGPYLKDLVQLMLDLASNKDADDDARSQALAFLAQAARYRRMKIQGMPDMGKQLTLKSMIILTELEDDEDDDDLTPARAALSLLDQLASDLPPRQIIVPLLDAFPEFSSSPDAGHRRAGILALSTVVEGAPDFVASQFKQFWPLIHNLLNDADASVRQAALIGVSRLADEIAEELAANHQPLMTALANNLQAAIGGSSDKKNSMVIRSVCSAIDSLAEGMSAEVMSLYAEELVKNIGALLQHDDYKIRICSATALGAIAESLGERYKPYFADTMRALEPFLMIKETEDHLELRSGVLDAVGRFATAVGRETFQPFVLGIMQSSEEALHLDNSTLRESAFLLWASLAKVYGRDFAHFLPGVFKSLFAALELEQEEVTLELSEADRAIAGANGEELIIGGKRVKIKQPTEEDGMEDDDEDDWEEDGGISTADLEKESALEVMADVFTNACGTTEISQYLEKAVEMVSSLTEHSYDGCRRSAISTLWRAYARVWQLYEEETGTKWQPGILLKVTPNQTLVKLGDIVSKATMNIWSNESERNVVTEINRSVGAVLKTCGPAILAQQDFMTQTISVLGMLITRSHPCQQDLGDEDEEQEEVEGSSEYDWLVIDTAFDAIVGLAFALGPNFGELWKIFEKPIYKFASSNEDIERSTAVGVMAECASKMGAEVTPYTPKMFTLLLKRLADTDSEARSNAAYAIGQLILNSNDSNTYLPHYEAILGKLESMLHTQESRMKDNAAGCVCRMIMAHPDRVPIAQVLPALVNLLPLAQDYEENGPVYECIYQLYNAGNPTVQELTPKLLGAFEQVLSPPEEQLEPETRARVKQIVQSLYASNAGLFQGRENLLHLASA